MNNTKLVEHLFVSHKQAVALKKLGFNEQCFAIYRFGNLHFFGNIEAVDILSENSDIQKAPLYQQVFDWFRLEHSIFAQPDRTLDSNGTWYYFAIFGKKTNTCEGSFKYEEAQSKCIDLLISILKKKLPKVTNELPMGFISVNDKLPIEGVTVDVLMSNDVRTVGYYFDNPDRSGWITNTGNGLFANQIWGGISVIAWKEY